MRRLALPILLLASGCTLLFDPQGRTTLDAGAGAEKLPAPEISAARWSHREQPDGSIFDGALAFDAADGGGQPQDDAAPQPDAPPPGPCSGYSYFDDTGHYYKHYVFERKVFADAQADCEDDGGYLATVTSSNEADFLANLGWLQDIEATIGLSDQDLDGSFEWVTGETFSFSAWASTEPDGGEKCVLMYSNGNWHDAPCSTSEYFCECEKP